MHLNPAIKVDEFLTAVKACKNDVTYETPEGDIMSLKSEISRYIFASNANSAKNIPGEVVFKNPDDLELVKQYLVD